jgi:hypothetical protein
MVAVLGIMGLVLAGTLKGLAPYRSTVNKMDGKIAELRTAQEVKWTVSQLAASMQKSHSSYSDPIGQAAKVRNALDDYTQKLNETVDRKRDPDKGFMEFQLIEAMHQALGEFELAVSEKSKHEFVGPGRVSNGAEESEIPDDRMQSAVVKLQHESDDLLSQLYGEMGRSLTTAKPQHRTGMVILLSTSLIGTLLMLGVVGFLYRRP